MKGVILMDNKQTEINKFKRQHRLFRGLFVIFLISLFVCLVVTILNSPTFNATVIIACSIFIGSVLVGLLILIVFDHKRDSIIKKYYGTVSKEDRERAKNLLSKILIVDKNEYDFYDVLRMDEQAEIIATVLKLMTNVKKVYVGLYEPIKDIEQELINSKDSNQYNDIEYNNFIFELIPLLENNLCDI